ncbi:DUF4352 domain-containing protein [Streptomyces sp. NPDC059002]|uniref:DUF4352 domain-containing protein n=1 Tax=Streptomyces sp. NPDC059002 TaxID=3346690 RepID=UPI0036C0C34E
MEEVTMRRFIAVVTLSVLTLGATVSCSGDDGDGVVTDPKSKSADSKGGSKSTKPGGGGGAADPDKANVGDTLSLKGMKDGSRLDATVEKFVSSAKSSDEFLGPAEGKKWVAVRLKLVNKGERTYEDAPSNGAQVADKEGQRFHATIAEVTAGPAMSASLKLPAGDTARGWVVFEIPKASTVARVQWTPDSGFAADTGQWKVG